MNDVTVGFKLWEEILSSLELMLQFEKLLLDAPSPREYKYLVLTNVHKWVSVSCLKIQGHNYLTSIIACPLWKSYIVGSL